MLVLLAVLLVPQADPVFEPYAVLGDNVTFFPGGSVIDLAHFPDGSKLAACTDRQEITVWERATGARVAGVMPGFRAESLAVRADGKGIVAGIAGGSVAILEFPGLKTLRRLGSTFDGSVAVSRDARRAVGVRKEKIEFFDLDAGTVTEEPHPPAPGPFKPGLAISPDGEWAASADGKGVVRVWKTSTRKVVTTHQVQGDGLSPRVRFSGDGKRLVVNGNSMPTTILDAAAPRVLSTWLGYGQVHETGNPGTLLALGEALVVLDPATRDVRARFDRPGPDPLTPGAVAPDGKSVAVITDVHGIQLLGLPDLVPTLALKGPAARILSLAVSAKGDRVAASSSDGTLHIWNLASKELLRKIDGRFPSRPHLQSAALVRWSDDGTAVDGLNPFHFARWNVATGAKVAETEAPQGVNYKGFVRDGESVFVTAGPAALQKLLPLQANRPAASFRGDSAERPSYTPDGQKLALKIDRGSVGLFDVKSGRLLQKGPVKSDAADRLLISPDAERVVVLGKDITVVLLKTGKDLVKMDLKGVAGAGRTSAQAWALSPDGAHLAASFDTPELHVWRLSDGALLQSLAGSKSLLQSAEFSRDGRYLLAGGWDRAVHVWARTK